MEESTIVRLHISCPDCGSSDALCKYSDGHTHCFSCGKTSGVRKGGNMGEITEASDFIAIEGSCAPLMARNISVNTVQKFNYQIGIYNGQPVHIANYIKNGKIIGQKIRTKDKQFFWLGAKNPGLYGMHLWQTGGKKIVVTEGEIDALTVSQMQGNKYPVVSLPHGAASAKKSIQQNLEYLESFQEVILMFDMDEPGQTAALECAMILSPGKAKIASLSLKDPNELLVANRGAEIIDAMWQAKTYLPSGIVNAADIWDEVQKPIVEGLSYPWGRLTELQHGVRPGELVILGAGTGLGKTTVFKQIAYHFLTEHNENVGLIFLEESNAMTALSMMSLAAGKPLHIPGNTIDEAEKKATFDSLFGKKKVYMYNNFGAADFDDIRIRMRYLALSCGVRYIFFDHLTALTSGDAATDERKLIDSYMTHFAELARELNIALFMISHLSSPEKGAHEEGGRVTIKQFRGSRSIAQWADAVWALERNQQAETEDERHTSTFRILKDRYTGQATGQTFLLKYDAATCRLNEVEAKPEFKDETKKRPQVNTNDDFQDF